MNQETTTSSLWRILLRVSVVSVVMLGAGELITRLWLTSPSGQAFDAELGWTWRPGAEILNAKEGGATIQINERGLVDDPITDKAGRFRVLGFGNSFMEAIQVPTTRNYTSIVERQVPGTDVVNLARSGMGPAHYPAVLRRFSDLDPDLLLVSLGSGDLPNLLNPQVRETRNAAGAITEVSVVAEAKDELKRRFDPILSRSALATWLMRRFKPTIMGWVTRWRGAFGDDAETVADSGESAPELDVETARDRLTTILRGMSGTAPVVVLDIPHIVYTTDGATLAAPDETRLFRDAANRAGVAYLNVGSALIDAFSRTGQPLHGFHNNVMGHGHLNEAGHAVVADAVARWLARYQTDRRPAAGPPATKPPQPPTAPIGRVTAAWANNGEDKVTRDDLRAARKATIKTSVFDGKSIEVFGARNEVVSFNLVLEAAGAAATGVSVSFDNLVGPNGYRIATTRKAEGAELFTWVGREIELFYVRYLQVKGLSLLTWGNYDERHVPRRMRRKHNARGIARGEWTDRPDADKFYPDIAVPLEIVGAFDIPAKANQSIWADIYIPKRAPAGRYEGEVTVSESGRVMRTIPVVLTVRKFTLPDVPHAKTMAVLGYGDVNKRYLGKKFPDVGLLGDQTHLVADLHFKLAHRHKVSLIDSNHGPRPWTVDRPRDAWTPRLKGTLFSPQSGYDGPGVNTPNDVFSIGTYGQWGWKSSGEDAMHAHLDAWATWFAQVAPATEVFLYLIDESTDWPSIERWSTWVRNNPGPGKVIKSLATADAADAVKFAPSLDIPTSSVKVAPKSRWELALKKLRADPRKRFFHYNGARPGAGSLALEDDGVAMRTWGWIQHKMGIDRWFVWETTYYNNFQGGTGETNVFQQAHTFGSKVPARSPHLGETGWNYTNGDGVLFYPGTDKVFEKDSYGIPGPIASLRLKHWRRGIQDADYLAMAAKVDPKAVAKIVSRVIPKVLWENGVDNQLDPTYKHTPVSWSDDPRVWEKARAELAAIIERGAR